MDSIESLTGADKLKPKLLLRQLPFFPGPKVLSRIGHPHHQLAHRLQGQERLPVPVVVRGSRRNHRNLFNHKSCAGPRSLELTAICRCDQKLPMTLTRETSPTCCNPSQGEHPQLTSIGDRARHLRRKRHSCLFSIRNPRSRAAHQVDRLNLKLLPQSHLVLLSLVHSRLLFPLALGDRSQDVERLRKMIRSLRPPFGVHRRTIKPSCLDFCKVWQKGTNKPSILLCRLFIVVEDRLVLAKTIPLMNGSPINYLSLVYMCNSFILEYILIVVFTLYSP